MRPRKVRRVLALMMFGAIAAGAFLGAGVAKASPATESAFINVLDDRGITYASRSTAITAGHAVCAARSSGMTDAEVARQVFLNSRLDYGRAGFFVGAAEAAFCPWYAARVVAA